MNLEKLTNEVFKETDEIINEFGPRLAGTKSDEKAALFLHDKAKKFSDKSHIEEFNINKGAFFGWINILVINFTAGVVLIWFNLYLYAAILSLLSVIILIVQFIFYLPMIDFLFPKRKAHNVHGIIEPKGEVKQQVIISGHHDSAPVFNFFIHQPNLYNLRTTGSIGLVILMFVTTLVAYFLKIETFNFILNIVLSAGLLLVLQMWFFVSKKHATPGAGDNLIATNVAFKIGEYFFNEKKNGNGLKNTRIIFASFDAEEEGLRGARAFVKKNKKMLTETKTYVLNADCLYDEKELFFLTSDLNDTVKLDDKLISSLLKTADKLNLKIKTQKQALLTGGTDAAEFGKAGISATTLIGMPWTNSNRSPLYHTPNDVTSNVNKQVVTDTLNLYITFIKDND
ncbi:M28 family metallopeptidase [Haploplasma axanthum]|nr:M28 family peptidase [Haploplasma axanthum]